MLVSASVASRLVQRQAYAQVPSGFNCKDKSRRVWSVYNFKIIQMIDNLCKMCVLYSCYKLNFKNEGTITLVTGAFFAIHSLHS